MTETLPDFVNQMREYVVVRGLVHLKNYDEALRKLKDSSLNSTTKAQLQNALESKEDYVIGRTFDEMDKRISQAMCWKCWPDQMKGSGT